MMPKAMVLFRPPQGRCSAFKEISAGHVSNAAATAIADGVDGGAGADGLMQSLGDLRPDVQDLVAKLCCSWWQYEARDREYLVAQTLPYLLVSCRAGAAITK